MKPMKGGSRRNVNMLSPSLWLIKQRRAVEMKQKPSRYLCLSTMKLMQKPTNDFCGGKCAQPYAASMQPANCFQLVQACHVDDLKQGLPMLTMLLAACRALQARWPVRKPA